MQSQPRFRSRLGHDRWSNPAALAVLALLLAACDTSPMAVSKTQPSPPVVHEATDATTGITSTAEGFTLDSPISTLDASHRYEFRILGPDGNPQTAFLAEHSKLLHFYAIRDDLSNFAHVHPTMFPDGRWTVDLPLTVPGPYHVYAAILLRDSLVGKLHKLVLCRPLTVPGNYQFQPTPPPASTAQVDGYEFALLGRPKAWTVMQIPARFTHAGKPVTDLESYVDSYAHMTSFRIGNHALGHAHPLELPLTAAARGGPNLTFHVEFPGSGDYRTFVEFQTGGQLHTAQLTVRVP